MTFFEKLMGATQVVDPEDFNSEKGFIIFNLFEEDYELSEEEKKEIQRQSWF